MSKAESRHFPVLLTLMLHGAWGGTGEQRAFKPFLRDDRFRLDTTKTRGVSS